jgi:hypothetical protein
MKTIEIIADIKLKKLIKAWKQAKEDERAAEGRRLAVEGQIIALRKDDIPDRGTVKIDEMKITTGFTANWDQNQLREVRENWPDGYPDFPFREELKPVWDDINYLREHNEDAYKLAVKALNEYAKKPGFKVE